MILIGIEYQCNCREWYVLPFDDYTDAECYILDRWQPHHFHNGIFYAGDADVWEETIEIL